MKISTATRMLMMPMTSMACRMSQKAAMVMLKARMGMITCLRIMAVKLMNSKVQCDHHYLSSKLISMTFRMFLQ